VAYSGYIDSASAEWAPEAGDELVALHATLEPSVVVLELRPVGVVALRATRSWSGESEKLCDGEGVGDDL